MKIKNFLNFSNKDVYLLSLVLLLSISRLIPHPPNFTPIVAVAITSGFLFKKKYLSFTVLIIAILALKAERKFKVYLCATVEPRLSAPHLTGTSIDYCMRNKHVGPPSLKFTVSC